MNPLVTNTFFRPAAAAGAAHAKAYSRKTVGSV